MSFLRTELDGVLFLALQVLGNRSRESNDFFAVLVSSVAGHAGGLFVFEKCC